MKKKDRTYSIIIVSDALSTNKEFVVSSKLIRNSIIGVTLLLVFFGLAIFDYLTTAFDKEKMKRLEAEDARKEEVITELKTRVNSLSKSLAQLDTLTEKILVVSGLKSPVALKEVGAGGGPSDNIDLSDHNINLGKNQEVNVKKDQARLDMLEKTNQLNKKSRELVDTLKFVRSVIDEQKLRLASTPSIWPTRGYLTDAFGYRRHPFTGKREFHRGVDIATQLGNRVLAPANGTVLVSDRQGYYGNLIIIDHGYGYTTRYGHLASFNVKEGERVKRGQIIGFVGNTGRSNAPHLHFEVRVFGEPKNPLNFIID